MRSIIQIPNMRKILFLMTLFSLIFYSGIFSQEKINIRGFGELPATVEGKTVKIDFGNIGAFSFEGTINPRSLSTEVALEKLQGFPGYKLYSKLGLEEISLTISDEGLEIEANIDTKKNLGKLFRFFNISEPKLEISAAISKESFELEGALDFSKKPVIINIRPDRTRLTLNKFGIGAEVSKGASTELTLSVSAEVLVKPTKFDPDLETVLEFSYNLMSQELSIAGSMTDTWKNPLGVSNVFKGKDVITLENTALEIGWIPGAPSPTTLGFAIEKGKFFHLDFGIVMSLSLDDGKVAIKANRNEMTMNDLAKILREGFNLKVPDVFPKNIFIKDAEILFAPQGGSVGEIPIDQGFTLKGYAKLANTFQADLDFYANLSDGFQLYFVMDNNFKDAILNELRNKKVLSKMLTPVLNTLQVKKAEVFMKAGKDLKLEGNSHYEVYVLNERVPIPDMQVTFDVKQMVRNVVDKIVEKYGGKATELAGKIGNSAKTAGKQIGQGAKFAKKVVTLGIENAKHLHPNGLLHPVNKHVCREKCIPERAELLIGKVLPPSLQAIQSFHDEIIDDMVVLVGNNPMETKNIREAFFLEDWKKLNNSIEEDWKSIWEDKFYYGLFIRKSAAIEGGNIYRAIVEKRKQEYINLRDRLYNDLISKQIPLPVRIEYDRTAGCGTFYRNDQMVKKYCGWYKNWHTILSIGYTAKPDIQEKILFYAKDMGTIDMYSIDNAGNMRHIINAPLNGIRKTWAKISWQPDGPFDGVIVFEDENGDRELYRCDDNGNLSRSYADNNSFTRIKTRTMGAYLNIEKGKVETGSIGSGAHSSMWTFEPVTGTNYVRIKNRWKGTYLHIENGEPEATNIGAGAWSSHWLIEPVPGTNFVRFQNRWKGTFLNSRSGTVKCTPKMAHWNDRKNPMWILESIPK